MIKIVEGGTLMLYALIVVCYIIAALLSVCCLICIVSIISHIVRRHVLGDRQRDLVCKINWANHQHFIASDIESLKYEEQNVFSMMQSHRNLIVMNMINILVIIGIGTIVIALLVRLP